MGKVKKYKKQVPRILQHKGTQNNLVLSWKNFSAIKYDSRLIDNTGNKPDTIVVNRYAGANGTFHHIYPKSELVSPLRTIEKCYIYFSGTKRNGYNSKEVQALSSLRNMLIKNNSANGYYWNPGTGFGGYSPEYRLDDPKNNPEEKCPKSMNSDIFETAKTTRPNNLKNLSKDIQSGKLKKDAINRCIDTEMKLSQSLFHNTKLNDWIVKKGSEREIGSKSRIYMLK